MIGDFNSKANYHTYYAWIAPAGITLSSATDPKPIFIAPEVEEDASYKIKLIVNDGQIDSAESTVDIVVKQVSDMAGPKLTIIGGNGVANEQLSFIFKTSNGISYVIEASDDLMKWTEIYTIIGTGQKVNFKDNRKVIFEKQYYRIKFSD